MATTVGPDTSVAAASAHRGRPRDPQRDVEICRAALELVRTLGYDHVSMDAVAAACGASKATVYRRWPSKGALVAEALHRHHEPYTPMVETGSLRGDLETGLDHLADTIIGDDTSLVRGLIGAIQSDPDLLAELRANVVADKAQASAEWAARCVLRGDLPAGTDLSLINQIAPALMFFRSLLTGEPIDADFRRRVVDELLMPLIAVHTVDVPPAERSTS